MNKIKIFAICIALLFIIVIPVSATTVAQLSWSKSFSGTQVKSTDTNEDGSLVVAGLSNGSILAFDAAGVQKWIVNTNASIKKLVSDKSGNTAWINIKNESGFITAAGVQTAFRNDSLRNTTDVSISQDGLYYAVAEKSPGKLWIYTSTGAVYSSNQSYYFSNYTMAQLDPVNEQYIIAVNESDYKIYKWNVSATGNSWGIMNPYRQYPLSAWDAKMDAFSYRINMSVSGAGIKSFILNSSSALNDQEIGNFDVNNISYCLTQSNTYTAVPINRTKIYNDTSYFAITYDPKVKYSTVAGVEYPYYITSAGDSMPGNPIMLYYNQKYYVINSTSTPTQNTQMVYSSDNGINFTLLTNSAGFANKTWLAATIHMGKMYVCGGYNKEAPYGYYPNCYNSTDGITWTYINNSYPSVLMGGVTPAFWSNGTALFALAGVGGTYVSYNNATNWILLNATNPFGTTNCYHYFSYYGAFKNRSFVWLSYGADSYTNNRTYYSIDGNIWVNASNLSGGNSNRSPVAASSYSSPTAIIGVVNGGDLTSSFMYQYNSANKTVYRSDDGLNWTGILFGADLPYAMNQSKQLNILLDGSGIYLISRDGVNFAKNASWLKTNDLQSLKVTIDKNTTSNDTYSLYYGNGVQQVLNTSILSTNLVSWNWFPIDTQTQKYALIYNTSKSLVGIPQSISIPELGGWIGIGETSNVTHVQINAGGFGTTYSGASSAGSSNQISTGDGASYSTEGRGLLADIYDISGVRKGTYSTGGQVNSVDIAQKTGLFTVGGGDDGKVYIFSKDSSSNWYVYFQGDSGAPITTTAMSYRGEAAVVGRTDGTFEYYDIQSASISGISVDGYFFKDGAAYKNQPVEIFISSSVPFNWSSQVTGVTDSTGKFSTTCEAGKYYNFTVNGGEGHTIYLASTGVTSVYVSVLTSQQPYSFDAQYNAANGGITSVYTTSTPTDTIQITVTDTNNGTTLATSSGTGNYVYTYPDPAGIASVQVTAWISRPGSAPFREIRTVVSPNRFNVVVPGDNTVKYALSTIGLMVMAGLFGYINARRGALLLVAVAGMLVLLDFLPKSLTMFVTIALAFAVLGLFGQRQSV